MTTPDALNREIVLTDLDTSMIVEASAGAGKTTSLVGRMLNLTAYEDPITGNVKASCSIERIAAVTFTHKAASELRTRFRAALEKRSREATGRTRELSAQALSNFNRCCIGTIHSFCARLLRERPIEAGIDTGFGEIDDGEDKLLREEAWSRFVKGLYAGDSEILKRLGEVGLEIGNLRESFVNQYADYPDVSRWPAVEIPRPDVRCALAQTEEYINRMEKLRPDLPADPGTCGLMPLYFTAPLLFRHCDTSSLPELMNFLETLVSGKRKVLQKSWPSKAVALSEMAEWERMRYLISPLLIQWREHRYPRALEVLEGARREYARVRSEKNLLNFGDLLTKTAALLREHPEVRRYLAAKYQRVLMDEFQDTDPIQAEIALLLTADDHDEPDWKKCRPRPGSLFVVGDPKQSIYRFRRADITTYTEVKDRIIAAGGRKVTLSANFRSTRSLADWVNEAFTDRFPAVETRYAPEYVPLHAVRALSSGENGPARLFSSKDYTNKDSVADYESGRIAHTIAHELETERPIPDHDPGTVRPVRPGDYMILTWKKERLRVYAEKLAALGIPHQVSGGNTLRNTPGLDLLQCVLRAAAEPENQVAALALLRSQVFGISDRELYRFALHGGRFSFRSKIPDSLDTHDADLFSDVWKRIGDYAAWRNNLPPAVWMERVATDLGLDAYAGYMGGPGGAGGFACAVELVRSRSAQHGSGDDAVRILEQALQDKDSMQTLPSRPYRETAVRIMNLHKAKGLESPVVFLADPSGAGRNTHAPNFHVNRAGPEPEGYMQVERSVGEFGRAVLAHPPDWPAMEDEEREFHDAEMTRLLYVAATRAGSRLNISARESRPKDNPWKLFGDHLDRLPLLENPGAVSAKTSQGISLDVSDSARALAGIALRHERCAQRSYAVATPSSPVTSESESALRPTHKKRRVHESQVPHGIEWGAAIHGMLDRLMRAPDSDLHSLAVTALESEDLDIGFAEDAVRTISAVVSSEIWKRALAAKRRFVEIPFQCLSSHGDAETGAVPTVVRGVIDLVFEQDDGWVLVDYKTDAVSDVSVLKKRAAHYSSQLTHYRTAWEKLTSETVAESGFFFTHCGVYLTVPGMDEATV